MPTLVHPTRTFTTRAAARRRGIRDVFEGPRWRALGLATDTAMLWVAGALAMHLQGPPIGGAEQALLGGLGAAAMLRLLRRGMYTERPSRMSLLDQTRHVAGATTFGATGALAASAVLGLDPQASRAVIVEWVAATVLVAGFRAALTIARRRARRRGRSSTRVIIVGAGVIGAQLERRLLAAPGLGLQPVGFLDADPPTAERAGRHGNVLGSPDDLARVVELTGAEHVMVAFSSAPDSTVQPLLRRCEELGLEVSVVPRLFENVNDRQHIEHIGGLPLVGLRRVDPKSWQFTVKHLLDRSAGTLLVALFSPVLLACALAVRLGGGPGPILFRQRRIGRDGQSFDILKFRSMREAPAQAAGFVPGAGAAPGGVEGDDRRTRLGTFLRRSSLDELPQLLNVMRGEMSLVGPRPERPEFVEVFGRDVRRYGDRHRVKSGMTGWAQVHGLRGQTSLSERVEWDNWYIGNWSLWLDLKILLMTPMAVLRSPEEGKPAEVIEFDAAQLLERRNGSRRAADRLAA